MASEGQKPEKVQMLCGSCGSTDVSRDAWGEWDVEAQDWVLGTVFDHAHCHACQGETRLVEAELG